PPRAPPSFPTRRSSDLAAAALRDLLRLPSAGERRAEEMAPAGSHAAVAGTKPHACPGAGAAVPAERLHPIAHGGNTGSPPAPGRAGNAPAGLPSLTHLP